MQFVRRYPPAVLFGVFVLSASGCGLTDPSPCLGDEVHFTVEPGVTFLKVGESVTLKAERLTCDRRVRTQEFPDWYSVDPSVATVDRRTGRVTAVGVGTAQINGDLPSWSVYYASVHVE